MSVPMLSLSIISHIIGLFIEAFALLWIVGVFLCASRSDAAAIFPHQYLIGDCRQIPAIAVFHATASMIRRSVDSIALSRPQHRLG
jgi:hypothetical protein